MNRSLRLTLVLLVVVAVLVGCSLTRVKTSWTSPDIHSIHFTKVVAFVVAKDEAVRRAGEQRVCERITTVPCTPAYGVVADTDRGNVDAIARRVDDAGFDGAVVLRYTGQRVQQTYVAAPPRAPLWGYYGAGWGAAYDPGYIQQDELVDVETTVYSVPDRKLLWAGTTESMNPSDIRRTIDEIVDAVAAEMRRTGLIPAAASK
jgi:hypothetical protein